MFGSNEKIGKKFFREAAADSLFVTSMFYTLQGEGPYAGMPALFIRLAKCNLDCSFCDTFFDDGDWMTFDQISVKMQQTITDYWAGKGLPVPAWALHQGLSPGIVLVMTGGEPLLQDNITEFMRQQLPKFKAVQVESNGIPVTEVPVGVTLVCSPKCAEKDGVAIKYFKPSVTILERADCLKFVMSSDTTSPYNSIPDWAMTWKLDNPHKEIYCSPMNVYNSFPQKIKLLRAEKGAITMADRSTVDEIISFWEPGLLDLQANQRNHEFVGAICAQHGFRLNLQQHLYTSQA
jgi:organic radical activating enzyme